MKPNISINPTSDEITNTLNKVSARVSHQQIRDLQHYTSFDVIAQLEKHLIDEYYNQIPDIWI